MKVISVIENEDAIKKILKHLGLWNRKVYPPTFWRARPPPKGNTVSETIIDYSESQLSPSDDYLYYDEEPACALHADSYSVEDPGFSNQ